MAVDVSVLIPLHRSASFVDVVVANVDRLVSTCAVTVSDPDDADVLTEVRDRVERPDMVRWLGPRHIEPGWVAHYNDLLDHVDTPYFMWLPHDDEIDVDYIHRCRGALAPRAVGAFGVIETVAGPGLTTVIVPSLASSVSHDSRAAYTSDANHLLFEWNLGVPMRSVFVTERVGPIVDTDQRSAWADVVWCYGLALDGALVEVLDATYRKRYHDGNTHWSWGHEPHPAILPYLRREVLRRPDLAHRDETLDELIRGSSAAGDRSLRRLAQEVEDARQAVELEEARQAHDELGAEHARVIDELARLDRHIVDLEAALDLARGDHRSAAARAEELAGRLRVVEGSRTWRLRRALRQLRHRD